MTCIEGNEIWRLIYQRLQSNHSEGILERLHRTACLKGSFCVRLPGCQKQQNPIELSLPHSTRMFLRALLSFLWNYFCKSWSLRLSDGKRSRSRSNCPWTFRVQMCGELSQVCPSQSQLGNAKEKGSKVMPNPGPQTQETLSKDGSTQAVRKFSLIPSLLEQQNQNWRSLYIELTYKHYINLLKNPIYTVTNDTYIKQRGMETKPKEIHSDCMFYL